MKVKFDFRLIVILTIVIVAGIYVIPTLFSDSQRTAVQSGPFKPYGGRREITFNHQNLPAGGKEYDANGNLRHLVIFFFDSTRRLTYCEDYVFDETKKIVQSFKKKVAYKHNLDYVGKTIFKRYDPASKTFNVVGPLVTNYTNGIVTAPPDSLQLDSFYKKYTNANGIPVVSSSKVPDPAILIAKDIVNHMLMKREDVRWELVRRKSRVLVMAETEMETDLPERRDWKKPDRNDTRLTPYERDNYYKPTGIGHMSDRQYWNQRSRGMGGNEVSCAEENLLGYAGTRYYGENILVHEFGHNIMSALETTDPFLYGEIFKSYRAAKSKGLYENQYAINNVDEYWAEGTQWWFWSNFEFFDEKKRMQSPDDLKIYDSTLYHILEKVYIDHHIPADIYYNLNLSPVR